MKNTNLINALWQGADLFRGEMSLSETFDLQVIALAEMYIKSNEGLANQMPKDQLWNQLTASGYGLKEKLESNLSFVEEKFSFLKNVFKYIRIPEKFNEARLFQYISAINKYPMPTPNEIQNVFEELLYKYGQEVGKREGYFITPPSISQLLPQLLNIESGEVYDGASGSDQLLVEATRYAKKKGNSVNLYGQEINMKIWALGKIHLFILGLTDAKIYNSNTLLDPIVTVENTLKKFDYILMNPPYSVSKWGREQVKDEMLGRFSYGLPSDANADMAFISHTVASLNENGKAAIVVPHGVLFRGGADGKIREELVRADLIEAVIGLPANLLFYTSIPVIVLIINKNKQEERKNKIQFIDASKEFKSGRGLNFLEDQHITQIVEEFKNGINSEMSYVASLEEVLAADANLSISKYLMVNAVSEMEGKFGQVKVELNKFEESSIPKKPLYEVAETFRGFNVPSISKIANPNGEYRVIQLVDVQEGEILSEQLEKVSIKDASKIQNYLLQEGDIIISNRGTAIKVAIVPKIDEKLILSHNFHGIRPKKGTNSLFIKAYLESPIGQAYIQSLQQGTMVKVMGIKELNNLPTPVQPIEIQEEIGNGIHAAEVSYHLALKEADQERKKAYNDFYEKMGISFAYQN
jgi:type I restriction enzyme M protein